MKKLIGALVLSLAMVLAMVSCTKPAQTTQTSAAAKKIVWRVDSILLPTHRLQTDVVDAWAAEITKRSGGRLEIQMFSNNQLGFGAANSLRSLQSGSIEVHAEIYNAAAGDLPALNFLDLPMLFYGQRQQGVADMWLKTRPIWERELAKWGVVPLFCFESDEQIIYNGTRPITKVSDMGGLKIRGYSAQLAELVQSMGGIPTTIAYNEMVSAAQRGVIDGMITGGYTGVSMNFWDANQKYAVVDLGLDYIPFITGVSKKAWDALPADLQKIVLDVSNEMQAKAAGIAGDVEASSWRILAQHGVAITKLSPEETAKVKAIADSITAKWVTQTGPIAAELMQAAGKK